MDTERAQLPKIELFASFFIYVGTVLFALYKAIEFGNVLPSDAFEFDEGWRFLNRTRDEYEEEWITFLENVEDDVYWLLAHVLISETCRLVVPKKVHIAHAVIGIAFALLKFDRCVFVFIAAMNITYYASVVCGKRGVWYTTVFWLIILNMVKRNAWSNWLIAVVPPAQIYIGLIVLAWLLLRATSFALEYSEAQRQMLSPREMADKFSIWRYLGYTFYLPVYQHGPPLVYYRYATMFKRVPSSERLGDFVERLKNLAIALIWLAGIYFVTELASHYIYVNVITYNPYLLRGLSSLPMYGLGYAMGQLFCNKYIIMYGLSIALARFDRIDAPDGPRCIGRIHLYSHMWRYFDQGLYDFLFRYIYCEICAAQSSLLWKTLASFATFLFIYLWHGYYMFLLAWVVLNLVLLTLEQLQRHAFDGYRAQLQQAIGHRNVVRLNAVVGSQLVLPSIITNLMFIGGPEIGLHLAQHTYFGGGGPLNYVLLSFVAYHFYQYSSAVHARERRARTKPHSN